MYLNTGRQPFGDFTTMNIYRGSTYLHEDIKRKEYLCDFKVQKKYDFDHILKKEIKPKLKDDFHKNQLGPGKYNIEKEQPKNFVSRTDRYSNPSTLWCNALKKNQDNITPGPQAYFFRPQKQSGHIIAPLVEQNIFIQEIHKMQNATPGPGMYVTVKGEKLTNKRIQSAKLYTTDRSINSKPPLIVTPAPGQYSQQAMTSNKVSSFLYRMDRNIGTDYLRDKFQAPDCNFDGKIDRLGRKLIGYERPKSAIK
ncbi:Sperm-tail_PG-rich repeat [Hexamita inflata]|uniref:Sperm-tail PG-rich repeat n=1 Tax=Hexamita inflata TaxID=28002 RepID=A0AA86U9B3_9EUKA|nr:Sperm-tail PG-rich repeat [Hexamita inflata]